jgi:4-aminobutyrate aminotransferase-like enzyme
MSMVNAFNLATAGELPAADRVLLDRRNRALGPAYRLFYRRPLHIVRGEGVWLFDAEGRRYLDAYNNVASLGHGRPEVVEAICTQARVLNTHTRYLHEAVVDYAEALLGTMPEGLRPGRANLMLTCTGSEANDLALRIAAAATGGTGVIVTRIAYHGVTAAVAACSPSLGQDNPLGPDVVTVAAPASGGDVGARFAAGVRQALALMRDRGVRPAALMVDTIFSSDGVFADPPGFLQAAAEEVRKAGGLVIADEVQAGFARTGSAMWGFRRHGLTPDLVTLGKPMGNGHPVAGVVARAEAAEAFGGRVRYFNTFGGNPVSVAAAAAVLRVIRNEGLQANAARVGGRLREGLAQVAARRGGVLDVRGDGLFLGMELEGVGETPARARAALAVDAMREAGVLISATGPRGNVLKIRPPLVLDEPQADLLIAAVDAALSLEADSASPPSVVG